MPAQISSESLLPQQEQTVTNPTNKPESTLPKAPTDAEKPLIKILEEKNTADPDTVLKQLASEGIKTIETRDFTSQKQAEDTYLAGSREKLAGQLDIRYGDQSTQAEHITGQVTTYVDTIISKAAGERAAILDHKDILAELSQQPFSEETRDLVLTKAQERVDLLFNSEYASKNPDKQKMVAEQTQQYIDLLLAAKKEGSLPQEISAATILQLVDENIGKLAYQDRAATENWLGDHGVRHLVDHNIKVSMTLADELVKHGQQVTAMDRLMMHQIMIDHDMGYAMDVVRDPINQGGFGADAGHNVLAAKFIREQAENPNSTLSTVFSPDQIKVIHEGILHHDSREIKFNLGHTSDQARAENLYSIIHTADNTHAFEDKLPEILYNHPDTLRVMRLMKTAGEIGDDSSINSLREQLISGIDQNSSFSDDDKTALKIAAGQISKGSYVKSVPRICGNKPEYSIDNKGILSVQVTESAIHKEVVGAFAQGQNEQLQKFIGDVTGIKKVDLGLADSVTSPEGTVIITMRTGESRAVEKTDYQRQIDTLISEPGFRKFVEEDADLSRYEKQLLKEYEDAVEGSEQKTALSTDIATIKEQRKANLQTYLDSKKTNDQSNESSEEIIG